MTAKSNPGIGLKAARTLQRRFRAKILYRKRRDRVLQEKWLGKEFVLTIRDELTGLPFKVWTQIVAYDSDTAVVRLRVNANHCEGYVAWDTDRFWSMWKTGQLVEA